MTARLPLLLFLLFAASQPAQTRAGKDYAVFFYVTDFQPGLGFDMNRARQSIQDLMG